MMLDRSIPLPFAAGVHVGKDVDPALARRLANGLNWIWAKISDADRRVLWQLWRKTSSPKEWPIVALSHGAAPLPAEQGLCFDATRLAGLAGPDLTAECAHALACVYQAARGGSADRAELVAKAWGFAAPKRYMRKHAYTAAARALADLEQGLAALAPAVPVPELRDNVRRKAWGLPPHPQGAICGEVIDPALRERWGLPPL